MTHLSAEEIKAWYEHGKATDRSRVIGHLAECETCRKTLSAYAAGAEPDVHAPVVSIEEAVQRGYAARKAIAPAQSVKWLRPLYGLAAAAAIVVAVLWLTPNRAVDDGAVRGSELHALSPIGASNMSAFTFTSPFQASRYRVTVRDVNGVLVMTADTRDMRLAVDAATRERFVAGQDYMWVVTALDATGETIAASAPVKFRYQP